MQGDVTTNFWHVDFGNLLTWAAVVALWLFNRGQDWRRIKDQGAQDREWKARHEKQSDEREKAVDDLRQSVTQMADKTKDTIFEMQRVIIKLTTISDVSEKRLETLERIYFDRNFGERGEGHKI